MGAPAWVLWGSELSPYALKLALCCRHAGLPYRFLPEQGGWLDNLRAQWRLERLRRGQLPLTWPPMTEHDELPLVPFLFGPHGENLYDSTAIAHWLDRRLPPAQRLVPEEPRAAFIAQLIDDYADEFLLYAVHHQRWVVSARDNDAGERVAREFRSQIGPLRPLFARWFSARQTRRLPYLFSVAPQGLHLAGLPQRRQPPTRAGFPPTHALLESAFTRLTDVLEQLLAQRPYLLGTRFTLADAAIYGQLGMNLSDPSTARDLAQRCPRLHRWLTQLHTGVPVSASGEWQLDEALRPLLDEIARIHLPLMQQNAAACERLRAAGQRRCNERAFNRGEALYDGVLDGVPFRSVAKSFQLRSWRDAQQRWRGLPLADRLWLQQWLPALAGLDGNG